MLHVKQPISSTNKSAKKETKGKQMKKTLKRVTGILY